MSGWPAGTFDLGITPLVVEGDESLTGAGRGETTFLYSGTGAAIRVNPDGVESQGWTISGFTVDCQSQGAYGVSVGQSGAGFKSASGQVSDVSVKGATTAGVLLTAAQTVDLHGVRVEDNDGDGIHAEDGAANTTCTFHGGALRNNGGRGALLEDARQFSFFGTVVEGNGLEGVLAQRNTGMLKNLLFEGCHFEGNNNGRAGTGHAQLKVLGADASTLAEYVQIIGGSFGTAGSGNYHVSAKWATAAAWFPWFNSPDGDFGEVRGGTETSLSWMARHLPTVDVDSGIGLVAYRQSVDELIVYTNHAGTPSPSWRVNENRMMVGSKQLVFNPDNTVGWA